MEDQLSPAGDFKLAPDSGPREPMASAPRDGLVPGQVWHYEHGPGAGELVIECPGRVAGQSFEIAWYPEQSYPRTGQLNVESRRFDWRFDSDAATDQHGHASPLPCAVGDQWNLLALAPASDDPERLVVTTTGSGSGWLQVIGWSDRPVEQEVPIDRIDTRRGTHSAFLYSRGNTAPYTCVPHGFNFLTPVTRASENSWPYQYHGHHGATPKLQALAFAHAPSPWIGNRSAFQVMPWIDRAAIEPRDRQLAFSHDKEWARPDLYRVELAGGIVAEMTAASRAGAFRFTFPDGRRSGVLLDLPGHGELDFKKLDDGRVAFWGWLHGPLEGRPDRAWPDGYVYGETRQAASVRRAVAKRPLLRGRKLFGIPLDRGPLGWLKRAKPRPESLTITLDEGTELQLDVATSFIGPHQARRNLVLEIGDATFDEVRERARAAWGEILDRLSVEGATAEQRDLAWTSLYQAYSWPNEHHENTGSADEPKWAYASPYRAPVGASTAQRTGCAVVEGRLFVNNGYWDTYRTAWPLYHFLTPELSSELLDGILQAFRDGGWMPRWSAPGYVYCMVGTSSDAVFADASAQGVHFDEVTAYDSAIRNACEASADRAVGRVGIDRLQDGGWLDTSVGEALSWTFENSVDDAAIAHWSASLAERADELGVPDRKAEFEANAVRFAAQSHAYRHLFDPSVGFFQGRRPDGSFRRSKAEFDPSVWGNDYTETNAWGMAFHAVHDVDGMIDLYGGPDAFAAKLDAAFSTPFTSAPERYGHYSYSIQEMNEAQAHGYGMVAMSNQPAHHIPFLYNFVGRPERTQELTRSMLDLLFVGGEIGQGYPGDEDNGEMSAWWLYAAMGLYPLFPGGGQLTWTSPLFDRFEFRRDDGSVLTITADGQPGPYVETLTVNGEPVEGPLIEVARLRGDVHLHFVLTDAPPVGGRTQ